MKIFVLAVFTYFLLGCSLAEINEFDRTYFKQPGQSYNGSTYDPAYAFQKTNNSTSCPNGTWPRSQYTGPGGGMYTGPGGGMYTGPGGGLYTGPGGGLYTGPGGGMYTGPGGGLYNGPGGGLYNGPGSYCTNRPSLRMLKQMGYY